MYICELAVMPPDQKQTTDQQIIKTKYGAND